MFTNSKKRQPWPIIIEEDVEFIDLRSLSDQVLDAHDPEGFKSHPLTPEWP